MLPLTRTLRAIVWVWLSGWLVSSAKPFVDCDRNCSIGLPIGKSRAIVGARRLIGSTKKNSFGQTAMVVTEIVAPGDPPDETQLQLSADYVAASRPASRPSQLQPAPILANLPTSDLPFAPPTDYFPPAVAVRQPRWLIGSTEKNVFGIIVERRPEHADFGSVASAELDVAAETQVALGNPPEEPAPRPIDTDAQPAVRVPVRRSSYVRAAAVTIAPITGSPFPQPQDRSWPVLAVLETRPRETDTDMLLQALCTDDIKSLSASANGQKRIVVPGARKLLHVTAERANFPPIPRPRPLPKGPAGLTAQIYNDVDMTLGFDRLPASPALRAPAPPIERKKKSRTEDISISMKVDVRQAIDYADDAPQSTEIKISPSIEWRLNPRWRFVASARFRADAEDNLEPGRPQQTTRSSFNRRILIGDRADLELRNFLFNGKALGITWTLGKQSIVWGQADGIRLLDIVNPYSYREFVLEDPDEARIPTWGIRAERKIGPVNFDAVFIPDRTYNEAPFGGATFQITSPRLLPAGASVLASDPSAVNNLLFDNPALANLLGGASLSDTLSRFVHINEPDMTGAANRSDYGVRASAFLGGWDLALLYFRHTEDTPVFATRLMPDHVEITPVYNRATLIGASFANAFKSFTLRGEIGYLQGTAMQSQYGPDIISLMTQLVQTSQTTNIDPTSLYTDTINSWAATYGASHGLQNIVGAVTGANNTPWPARGIDLGGIVHGDTISYILGLDYFGLRNTVLSAQFEQSSAFHTDGQTLLRANNDFLGTFGVRRTLFNERVTLQGSVESNLNVGDYLIRFRADDQLTDKFSVYGGVDSFLGTHSGVFGEFQDASRVYVGLRLSL